MTDVCVLPNPGYGQPGPGAAVILQLSVRTQRALRSGLLKTTLGAESRRGSAKGFDLYKA